MKPVALAAAGLGIVATVALVGYFGAGSVVHALVTVGLLGFAAVCLIHLGLIGVMGIALRLLLPGTSCRVAIWARLLRDAGSDLLPLSQVGGYVIGARAMTLAGIPTRLAAASTIADVTLEFVGQIGYTAIGLVWLVRIRPHSDVTVPVAAALIIGAAAAIAFLAMQHRGFDYVARIAGILGRGWAERTAAGATALGDALAATYRRRTAVGANCAIHLACWVASTAEAWLFLRLAGAPLPFGVVLVIESLLYATRSAAFFVPAAVGVQEGAYIVLGAAFGLGPDMALALSLLKRARDLVIELPALGAWQIIEGGRLWRRTGDRKATPAKATRIVAAPPE